MEMEKLQFLLPLLGAEFIAYASNSSAEDVQAIPTEGSASVLTESTAATLKDLLDSVSAYADIPEKEIVSEGVRFKALDVGMFMGVQLDGNSIGNALRLRAGGELPAIPATDTLETELAKLARDVYPLFLLPLDNGPPFPDFMTLSSIIGVTIHRNKYQPFFDALETEKAFHSLYEKSGSLKSFTYWLNTGVLAGQHASLLPCELMIPAYYRTRIEGNLTPEAFIEQTIENLRMVIRLACKEAVEVPAYLGINGIALPKGKELQLPWGVLRNPTDTEWAFLEPRSATVNSIFVTSFKLKMATQESDVRKLVTTPYPFVQDRARSDANEAAMLMSASLMVSLGKEVRAENVGMVVLPPFGQMPSISWPLEMKPGLEAHMLTPQEQRKLLKMSDKIERHQQHLRIALRRNLSAINRLDILDGFIDGVIAMESLFGSNIETTFTISAAMAKFLEPDLPARLSLKEDVRKLYGRRCEIVHGRSFPDPASIEVLRQRTIDLNILTLKKLLNTRTDLIACASDERSARILLS